VCLLTVYSVCIIFIILLQIAALVFINLNDDNIEKVKELISGAADTIAIDTANLKVGSQFLQNLFFGVSAGLSSIVLLLTLSLCCTVRREGSRGVYDRSIQA
jgi:hypothetical protein